MTWVFWGAAAIIIYAYLGYAAWLWVRSRWRSKPVERAAFTPSLSIVMVVRNESGILERKLRNLLELDYPEQRAEVVVLSDGSSDGSNEILSRYGGSERVRSMVNSAARGKAAGLNDAIAATRGEIVVFTDARQKIESAAVRLLAENFADQTVGCASGELMLGDPDSGEAIQGMGLYWKFEKKIREMESASGSVVGATGALYAVRRSLLVNVPPETILDDVYIPMNVVRQGFRVIFDPRARAWDIADQGTGREFNRKVRTLSGNYQLLQLAPWLLGRSNPLCFEFVSHKLMRLVVPFALAATLLASMMLQHPIYRLALVLQIAFYALSFLVVAQMKRGLVARMADAAFTFVILNTAALVAFANFVTGRKAAWNR
jgi:cellulose synthase/poly-beta-1,6-N-acetylglucosamine synthase-like glycosyltransferase